MSDIWKTNEQRRDDSLHHSDVFVNTPNDGKAEKQPFETPRPRSQLPRPSCRWPWSRRNSRRGACPCRPRQSSLFPTSIVKCTNHFVIIYASTEKASFFSANHPTDPSVMSVLQKKASHILQVAGNACKYLSCIIRKCSKIIKFIKMSWNISMTNYEDVVSVPQNHRGFVT